MRHVWTEKNALLAVAVVLMLGGAALLLAEVVASGVAIPLIAVGIGLVVIAGVGTRDRARGAH